MITCDKEKPAIATKQSIASPNAIDMAGIQLEKGQRIDLNLSRIWVGLGWNPNKGTGAAYDLDASAFMLNAEGKIPSETFFVFYGNAASPDGALWHSGDDPTGGKSETSDDEILSLDLEKTDAQVTEIIVVVTIHEATRRRQNFGQIRRSYIRLVDVDTNLEIAKYELDEDYSTETAIEFGRIFKQGNQWRFQASGTGHNEELAYFVSQYYSGEIIK